MPTLNDKRKFGAYYFPYFQFWFHVRSLMMGLFLLASEVVFVNHCSCKMSLVILS